MSQNRTEWVIHIWGKKRDTLELNDVEKFHFDMIQMFKSEYKKFDKILVNIAMDDDNDTELFNFLKKNLSKAFDNENVEFLHCQNDKDFCEYVTFKPYVFDRIGEDVNIFYSHFKGYGSNVTVLRESYPTRVTDLCELFWAYLMYQYSMNVDDVIEKLKDHCTYSWFVLNNESEEDINTLFFTLYHKQLSGGDSQFKDFAADNLHKYTPGSFVWYNMKNIGEELKNKKVITSVTTEYLIKQSELTNLRIHFSEAYLMNFLKKESCYSVNDFNKEMLDMNSSMYLQLYPAKTIGKEYVKDFEKYLIEKGLL